MAIPPTAVYEHEVNRLSWNAATIQHRSHKPHLIQQYIGGYNNLFPDEIGLLGDLSGKHVVHLQCNDGQDTVSIARLDPPPASVTGVDISDTAVGFAQELESAMRAAVPSLCPMQFVRSDIFTWMSEVAQDPKRRKFDVVYTGYGALCWVSDLTRWAQGIRGILAPGGKVVVIEFHPFGADLDDTATRVVVDSIGGTRTAETGVGDYVANDYNDEVFKNPHPSFEFHWAVGEVAEALIAAGLSLTHLKEYDYINAFQRYPDMKERKAPNAAPRQYVVRDGAPRVPLMYSTVAAAPL